MGKKSAPPPPDYMGAAQQQAQGNQAMQQQNIYAQHSNTQGPWGSSTWNAANVMDANGQPVLDANGKPLQQWTETQTLAPELLQSLQSQMGIQQGRSDLAGSMLPWLQQQMGQP